MGKKRVDESAPESVVRIESRYQPGLLRQCVQEGLSAEVIMERLAVKNMQTLRKHLLRLMAEDKAFMKSMVYSSVEAICQRSMPKAG